MENTLRKLPCAFLFALLVVLPVVLLFAPLAHAALTAVNVTSTAQEEPFLANGNCTLGEALASISGDAKVDNCVTASGAYGTGGPFVVNLAAGATYTLTTYDNNTGGLFYNGLPAITRTVTINGNGATIARDSVAAFRIFFLETGGNLTLNSVSVNNGQSMEAGGGLYINTGATAIVSYSSFSNNGAGGGGGAIYSRGTLSVTYSTFSNNNQTTISNGGGILNSGGKLAIANSVFTGNSGGDYGGGGVYSGGGQLSIIDSTFASNYTFANGGAVSTSSNAVITGTTFSLNTSGQYGGGISSNGPLTVTNSTFSGNGASYGGGVINNMGTAVVRNSTFSDNRAPSGGGGVYSANGAITLYASILANSADGGDCSGTVTDGGNNLVEDNTCSFMGGSDPALGPLGDYGGPTQTMPLGAGSPALNAGNNATCAASDQRGVPRPQGLVCDIGAFEYRIPTVGSLSPTFAHVGDPALTLTITGTSFVTNSTVLWNGSALASTFVSASRLTASVPAMNLTAAGPVTVTVSNPLPEAATAAPALGFTIAKGAQTITFAPLPDRPLNDSPFTVAAAASSGLPVSFGSSGQCVVSGNTVTLTGVGSCAVTASQPGNANYNAAPNVIRSFMISLPQRWIYLPLVVK